uniref:NADH-ubiquinone oxidoreductase chain 4 n=1 Tax=Amerotyphlops reticulatus TaxID=534403 RepID=B3GT25_9SAUR|nr:NADH dehydrogenase subunit 4 [Amerotyphlops reticulatus]ACD85895.1 NADH dehydrogenase subunit 4 [Amerotyphlops reticulatus]
MMKMMLPTLLLIPSTLILKPKLLFPTMTGLTFLLALLSLTWMNQPTGLNLHSNMYTNIDQISTPLLVLSYWLLPMMILASQSSLMTEPAQRQRLFLLSLTTLHALTILTFTASSLTLMYIAFEATLIPTMVLITRWGHQAERLTAGSYFMIYTLLSSMPLLIAILYIDNTLIAPTLFFIPTQPTTLNWHPMALWMACMMAFLVKMPMYGFHLWLPKAHVEAPVAGSMVLAAILLKMGGYGMIRILQALPPEKTDFFTPLIVISLWGMIMTNATCLQQTDLKSLIAYSSIGHMGLVITALLIQTPWGLSGAMLLMIAHGFTSSLLFCLTNMSYERTNTRLLILTKGLFTSLPLMTSWWLLVSLMNIALPPTMNFTAEITIMSSTFNWSNPTIIHLGLGTLITAMYTLHMFSSTQFGKPSLHQNFYQPAHSREHLLASLHIIPLALISLKPELIM